MMALITGVINGRSAERIVVREPLARPGHMPLRTKAYRRVDTAVVSTEHPPFPTLIIWRVISVRCTSAHDIWSRSTFRVSGLYMIILVRQAYELQFPKMETCGHFKLRTSDP